jgi:hypothetical protein
MANVDERPRAGGRTATIGGRRVPESGALAGDLWQAAGEQLARAFRAEADAARLAPWLPVCFGIGVIFYFTAPAEPSWIAAATSFLALVDGRDKPGHDGVIGCGENQYRRNNPTSLP